MVPASASMHGAMVLRIRPLGLKRPGRHNPAAHNQFVGYYYPYEAIVSITITGYGYDIILSNGTELSFDHYGEVYD